jgi:NAD(P)-dependent dehydrogenase (short-subunit alcohol dehydrogenase family)
MHHYALRLMPSLTKVSREMKRQKHAETVASLGAQDGHSRLSKKVVLITGAATGIGCATALLFAKEGARVIVADINETDGLKTEELIAGEGGEGVFIRADVTNESDVKILVDMAIERYGKLDVLVNNAGIMWESSVVNTPPSDLQHVLDINLAGVFRCCRIVIPEMVKRGEGSVINMASVQGMTGFYNASAYAASKGGVIALTRQMAREYSGLGIRVNCISPGIILTTIFGQALEKPADREALFESWANSIPLGHFGLPQDVAYAALFLASDESSFVTGANLVVDGGLTIRGT